MSVMTFIFLLQQTCFAVVFMLFYFSFSWYRQSFSITFIYIYRYIYSAVSSVHWRHMELLFGLSLTAWLVAAVFAVAIYIWYNCIFNHYWKIRNVPANNPLANFRQYALKLKNKPMFQLDDWLYKNCGRFCGYYFVSKPRLLISTPELLRQILVKDFHVFPNARRPHVDKIYRQMLVTLQGEEWKRMRMIVSPVFTSGKMRKLAIYINQSAEVATNSLLKSADSGTNVEIRSLFGAFAMDVIASTSFATKLDSINNPDNIFVTQANKLFCFSWRWVFLAIAPRLMKRLKVGLFDPEVAIFFSGLLQEIRDRRIREGQSSDDFLQMLIDAEAETANDDSNDTISDHFNANEAEIKTKEHIKKTLSADELVAQCVMFFLAGYHTTSSTISLTCYNLARQLEYQEKLINEVDEAWKKYGKFDFDVINGMKYLDAVVSESLRLYPPIHRLERQCVQDYPVGNTGITIPSGTVLSVPVYSMHRDPEFFSDPETFNPDRFLPENKDLIQPYTYLPFGAGPRNCVAMRFALMEVKLCLVNVLRHVSFHLCSETKVPLEFKNGLGFLQPKAVTVKVERRAH